MVTQLPAASQRILYPDSDGQPMADNTEQFNWIVRIKENLELLFAEVPDVFVAGDLLWYPLEGDNKTRIAPDVLVAFGRPKGRRGSYQQWQEDNLPPQVVFEILSPGNRQSEMAKKFAFYDRHGVEEYYLYDPDKLDLAGWLRSEGRLNVIEELGGWVSPRLSVRFELTGDTLELYRPDGQRFFTYLELEQQRQQERQHAEQERQRAEQERQRAEQAETLLEQERQRSQALLEQLRALGVEPEQP